MEVDKDKFELVKNNAKEFYDKVGAVNCPYLNRDVHFNEEGFSHLLSKSWNRGRSLSEQYIRLKILPKVIEVIRKSHTLQEYDERQMLVRQKINSRWEKRPKLIRYFVFIALVIKYNCRFKVVIKEIEGGKPFFWSVYPSWRVMKDCNGDKKKVFYSGNLEED